MLRARLKQKALSSSWNFEDIKVHLRIGFLSIRVKVLIASNIFLVQCLVNSLDVLKAPIASSFAFSKDEDNSWHFPSRWPTRVSFFIESALSSSTWFPSSFSTAWRQVSSSPSLILYRFFRRSSSSNSLFFLVRILTSLLNSLAY